VRARVSVCVRTLREKSEKYINIFSPTRVRNKSVLSLNETAHNDDRRGDRFSVYTYTTVHAAPISGTDGRAMVIVWCVRNARVSYYSVPFLSLSSSSLLLLLLLLLLLSLLAARETARGNSRRPPTDVRGARLVSSWTIRRPSRFRYGNGRASTLR